MEQMAESQRDGADLSIAHICSLRFSRASTRPPRTPDEATHRTLAATDDMASLLRFFLLDTAVPMLKGKRLRREHADHSTDWLARETREVEKHQRRT